MTAQPRREWHLDEFEPDDPDRELVERAQEAAGRAYAPYSLFAVGAALRTKSGKTYTAANLENASSGLTICAEAAALSLANAAGDLAVEAIAVVGFNFRDPPGASSVVAPCGSCRQLILEAAQMTGSEARVLSCNGELSRILVSTAAELLPQAFGPENLGRGRQWPALQQQLRNRLDQLIALRTKR